MEIKFNLINDILYVKMIGELDDYTASYTRNILDEGFISYSFDKVVYDLSELEFVDSSGIGVLIGRYKVLKSKNKPIFITNPSKTIEKIFKMSGIFEIMPKIS